MKKIISVCTLLLSLVGGWVSANAPATSTDKVVWDSGYVPHGGFVPDADTASKLAEVVLIRWFGLSRAEAWKPYHIELVDGDWRIRGQMKGASVGGTAEIRISKSDGRIGYVVLGQ